MAERVDLAVTFFARLRGLLGPRPWEGRDGLWLEPCSGVHGLGLRQAIDVILVDEALTVLWLRTLRPWRLGQLHLDARAALELPEGSLVRSGTAVGDVLWLER